MDRFEYPVVFRDEVALRVAHRHAAVALRGAAAADDLARDDDEHRAACSDGGSVAAEDVERLLGHAGVRMDAGSVRFDEHASGEVEIPFTATRSDGRSMTGVLVLRLRADRDGGAVKTFAEIGPLW